MSTKKNVNKTVIGIVTAILIVGSLGLAGLLSNSIYSKYSEDKIIVDQEKAVKARLKMIRSAQELYYREKDVYAGEWGNLIDFVVSGKLYTTERNEKISFLPSGREEITVSYDTIAGPFSVADSLFPTKRYPDFNINSLNLVPNTNVPFILRVDTLDGISVFEVVDAEPVDPKKISGEVDTLKLGSLFKVTVAGNWEK